MKRILAALIRYTVLLIALGVMILPLLWMTWTSFKTQPQVTQSRWSLPTEPHGENYAEVFGLHEWRGTVSSIGTILRSNFTRCFLNSLWISTVAVALSTAAAALAGFAFSRLRFRFAAPIFVLFLLGMMIPVHITLVPLVKLFGSLYPPAVLVGVYAAFALPVSIFILRGFFRQVPVELEEAARVDGCGAWGVFWHICLPLAKPALAVVVIFNFVTIYNEFIFALVFLRKTGQKTLPIGLMDFSGPEGASDIPVKCAALVCAVIPILVVYFLAQRQIIRGLTAGAVKE